MLKKVKAAVIRVQEDVQGEGFETEGFLHTF